MIWRLRVLSLATAKSFESCFVSVLFGLSKQNISKFYKPRTSRTEYEESTLYNSTFTRAFKKFNW